MKKLISPGQTFIVTTPPFPKSQSVAHEPWKMRTWDVREFSGVFPPTIYVAAAWTLKSGAGRVYWYNALATYNQSPCDPHNIVEVFNASQDMGTPDWPHTGQRGGNYYNRSFRGREVFIET